MLASAGRLGDRGMCVLNVHAKNNASTNGTVMKYIPHFVHRYSGELGRRDMASRPTKGGMQARAMM